MVELAKYDPDMSVGNDDAEMLDYVASSTYSDDSGWHDFVELRFEEDE
jgi:hypothetical protein